MRVLLTGATGFIGSHVARLLLREGCEVSALVRPAANVERLADIIPSITLLSGDIFAPGQVEAELRANPPELCLHLGWYAVPGKYLQAPENIACVAGSMELFQLLDAVGCQRVVAAGTCFEYDTGIGYLAEASPIRPQHLYSAAKHALYLMAEQFQRKQGRSFAWARIFYLFGPHENERRLMPHVIQQLLSGAPCPLTAGNQIRDYLHVEDVASALWAIARSDVGGPVNIGSGHPTSVAAVARIVGTLLDRSDLLQLGALPMSPGDPPFVCANTQLLRSHTGWEPHYDLHSGLAATAEWWRQRLAQANPGPSVV